MMSDYQIPMEEALKTVNGMMKRANISVYEIISCAVMNGADVDKAVRRAIGEVIVYLMDKKYWEKHHDTSCWAPCKDEFFEKVGECMKTVYGLSEDRISCIRNLLTMHLENSTWSLLYGSKERAWVIFQWEDLPPYPYSRNFWRRTMERGVVMEYTLKPEEAAYLLITMDALVPAIREYVDRKRIIVARRFMASEIIGAGILPALQDTHVTRYCLYRPSPLSYKLYVKLSRCRIAGITLKPSNADRILGNLPALLLAAEDETCTDPDIHVFESCFENWSIIER